MITLKEAVEHAVRFFKEVSITDVAGIRVEEVKLSDDEQHWLITLGFLGEELVLDSASPPSVLGTTLLGIKELAHPRYQREYKLFRVRREDGAVEEMTIRTLATA